MAGVATLSAGAILCLAFLTLAFCMIWIQWVQSGGPGQLSYIISNAAYDFRVWCSAAAESIGATASEAWGATTAAISSVERKYRAGMKRLAIAWAAVVASTLLPDEEVYRLTMTKKGEYPEYIFKMPLGKFNYDPALSGRQGDNRYKFGTTKMAIGRARYNGSLLNQYLRNGSLVYTVVINFKNRYESRMIEKRYIYAYYMLYGIYPPGNSKLG